MKILKAAREKKNDCLQKALIRLTGDVATIKAMIQ